MCWKDDENYIQVNKYLQSVSHDCLFAVGDCCNFQDKKLPKAGVYSVREVLIIFIICSIILPSFFLFYKFYNNCVYDYTK